MQRRPRDTPDRIIDTNIIQKFYQKQILANLSDATINLILCCFSKMTIKEMTNPARKHIPMTKEITLFDYAQVICIYLLTNGNLFPKYLQRNPAPNSNMLSRMRGIIIQAEAEGIMKLMTTRMKLKTMAVDMLIKMLTVASPMARRGLD